MLIVVSRIFEFFVAWDAFELGFGVSESVRPKMRADVESLQANSAFNLQPAERRVDFP